MRELAGDATGAQDDLRDLVRLKNGKELRGRKKKTTREAAFSNDVDEARERRALRLIALTFFVLAAYVSIEALRDVIVDEKAETSIVGIVLACVSLAVMPTLAWFKRRTGGQLGSRTLVADSAETFLCVHGCRPCCWSAWWRWPARRSGRGAA